MSAGSLALALVAGAAGGGDAYYVDASIDLDAKLLDWRFVDVDGDGARELVLGVLPRQGDRELRIYRRDGAGLAPTPARVVPLLDDILAWGVADVRPEPGNELLFLTRSGMWSYSPTLDGYRDNARPLARAELIYDFADPADLGYWAYVLPRAAQGRDGVLVPEREGLALWGPTADDDGTYQRLRSYPRTGFAERLKDDAEESSASIGGGRVRFEVGSDSIFLADDPRGEAALFAASMQLDAPGLVDLDGDGRLDMVLHERDELRIHLAGPDGPPSEPTRVEPLPAELLEDGDVDVELRLVDLDGDGDLDLLAHAQEEADGLENAEHRVLVYTNDGRSLVRERPDQLLRFEAGFLAVGAVDVDGDGRRDLALRKLVLPSMVETVTGVEFEYSYLVFLGERRGFERRPTLRQVETYTEDTVADLAANRELVLDCDGDGRADLVELDLRGGIAVRRLTVDSSFFGGDEWKVEAAPWKRFETRGAIESLVVDDFNGDGLGDIVSASEGRLVVLLTARGRSR